METKRPPARYDASLALGSWILLAVALLLVLGSFADYGITWDESAHVEYGRRVLAYYAQGFDPRWAEPGHHAFGVSAAQVYGGLFHLIQAMAEGALPGRSLWETRHLVDALFALLGVVGCARLAALFGGGGAAFFATLLMLCHPIYVGHAFFNCTDIPFAVGYVWSLYFLARFVSTLPEISKRVALGVGLAIGCTAAVRVLGLVLLGYLWLLFFVALALTSRDARLRARLLGRVLGASAIAYATMIAFWPWAQQDPIVRPVQTLSTLSSYPWGGEVLFQGAVFHAKALPWYYSLKQMLIQTPEIHLFASLLLAPVLLRSVRAARSSPSARAVLLVAVAVLLPVVYPILRDSVLFDSFRHLLFVVPPLLALLGYAIHVFVIGNAGWKRAAAVGVLALGLGVAVVDAARLHPYEYAYYNRLVGGIEGAAGRYELDYWGSSYKELVAKLAADLPRDERHAVFVHGPLTSALSYFPPHFFYEPDPEAADIVLALTRTNAHLNWSGREVARVSRLGAPLSVALRARDAE